ncbi:lysozyme [Kluyvera sp. CHPC 1.2972]|uniref:lysozyme n=1 Tax=Kluyvera sp. CHPC 1.2972 TaxID=2995176 RepID=UPI002FD8176D
MSHVATPSLLGLELIKQYQGLSLEKYQDADGLWVVGYGHLIRDRERFDEPITLAQAEELFQQDVDYYHQILQRCVRMPLSQHQSDALLSLAFSLGPEAVQQCAIMRAVNQGHMADALALWQQQASPQTSLAVQRQAEAALFRRVLG